METKQNFTTGRILLPLIRFAVPVLLALFLQSMYGAVDLLIVGKFASAPDVSAVSTGSQIMQTLTGLISSFALGTTVFIAERIGQGREEESGRIIGGSIALFAAVGLTLTLLVTALAGPLSGLMQAPEEAFVQTTAYVCICGAGSIVIIAYNLLGSIFRGFGDSRTPLITVAVACVCNILGDLLLVAVFHMAAAGAAIATVAAQAISVAVSWVFMRRRLHFSIQAREIRWHRDVIRRIFTIGSPIALQDFLVGISFLVIMAIVNSLGVIASAGVGVADKLCGFIMLVPSAFMQSMSAFVAQNRGAGKPDRAIRALRGAVAVSCTFGLKMAYFSFFHGSLLAEIFAREDIVITAAAEYLKAYAIDCLLTCFLFCFIGFFNGMGQTRFVMVQGLVGAFLVRIPVSFLMSRLYPTSLFAIGCATPCSSAVQILLCFIYYFRSRRTL